MFATQLTRFFHATCCNLSASSKTHLAELRKKTGYTFANCKKALEVNNNDLAKAEHWLKEQAQALGWAKATKLQGRAASQGLIGVAVEKAHAAIVEVNCETDFVAKNDSFKSFVKLVAGSCLQASKQNSSFSNNISKTLLGNAQLKEISCSDGKSLADHSALVIGTVGENVVLSRAVCLTVNGDLKVTGYTHPPQDNTSMPSLGRFGSIVVLKSESDEQTTDKIGKQLCQHIIGMNPSQIGSTETDKPDEDADSEKTLIFQEFLIDSELTVQDVLVQNKINVVDFVRFESCEEQNNEQKDDQTAAQHGG